MQITSCWRWSTVPAGGGTRKHIEGGEGMIRLVMSPKWGNVKAKFFAR